MQTQAAKYWEVEVNGFTSKGGLTLGGTCNALSDAEALMKRLVARRTWLATHARIMEICAITDEWQTVKRWDRAP